MKKRKDTRVYIEDIHNAIQRIENYISDGKRTFLSDEKTQDAVIRNLAVIGEAVKKLPKSITMRFPQIPWKNIAGMRDILIHDYAATNMYTVWETLQKDLPPLAESIELMRTKK